VGHGVGVGAIVGHGLGEGTGVGLGDFVGQGVGVVFTTIEDCPCDLSQSLPHEIKNNENNIIITYFI
jgi:hypothetical protein